MHSAFTYTEYSYNPDEVTLEDVEERLHRLGFVCSAEHVQGDFNIWNQNKVIIVVYPDEYHTSGIAGTGYSLEAGDIERLSYLNFDLDLSTTTYRAHDPNGIVVSAMPFEIDITSYNFRVNSNLALNNSGVYLNNTSGFVYRTTEDVRDFYSHMDFRESKKCRNSIIDYYDKINIRFINGEPGISTMICDTQNVFATTAALTAHGFTFPYHSRGENLGVRELDWKINAYDCIAVGNKNSYSIEQYLPDALPGMDLIIRSRKNYMPISEETLKMYYGAEIS